ncbi:MAG TPA: hypothetical protein PKX48_05190 [Planctomycetota bacterium]|jgi:hypothetical protein|nr:hypothetical protein [Planctomycetota bacterium]OQC20320.1 MAG: hypothetical protein BWX69_01964 [Planctomycetes bacterium ADurb.Bin069]HNR98265.1 hypothetical protein [Planctomycetota bacterium]HNU24867.1 hypothetical protein [Planctomycetota bacterium]HOE29469.1 hypothetical protein [Planctomycetota bacterium]
MRPLLRVRVHMLRNSWRNLRKEDVLRFAVLFLLFGAFIAGGMILVAAGFRFVLKLPAMGEILSSGLVQFLFFILFNFLILSNLLVGYAYLFRGRRTELYFALPLPAPRVFALHAAEAIVQSSWATFVLVAAVLVSYGASHGAGLKYYAFMPAVLAAFLLLCGAIGILGAFLLGLLRRRFGRKVFTIAGAALILAGGAYLAAQIKELSLAPGQEMIVLTRLTERLRGMSSSFWPGKWTSHALLAFARGFDSEGFFSLGLTASAACALWPILDLLGRHRYLALWQDLNALAAPARRRTRIPPVRGPLAGLIRKDVLLFARDPTQSLQLIVFLLLMALYTVSLLRIPREALPAPYGRFIALANLTAIAFILASFSSRFVYPLLESEGVSIWILMSAPISRRAVLAAKLLLGFLLMLPAAVGLAVVSQLAIGTEAAALLRGMLLIALLAAALTALALGFSAAFARWKSDRPSVVLGTTGGTANFLASTGLVALVSGLWVAGDLMREHAAGAALQAAAPLCAGAVIAGGLAWSLRALTRREY